MRASTRQQRHGSAGRCSGDAGRTAITKRLLATLGGMSEYVPLQGVTRIGPWDAIPLSAVDGQVDALARRVADSGEEIALTDEEGNIVAVVISPSKLEDLEDDLAIAQNSVDRLQGRPPTPHEDFLKELESNG